jgi:hypothetical protein
VRIQSKYVETGEGQTVTDTDAEYARGFRAALAGVEPESKASKGYREGHANGLVYVDDQRRTREPQTGSR